MTAKAIFSFSRYSSLYTAFAALTVHKGLDTALAAVKYIRIIIGGIVVGIIITFIYQSGSLSDSNLNFALTI